jgi:hypothetical protein
VVIGTPAPNLDPVATINVGYGDGAQIDRLAPDLGVRYVQADSVGDIYLNA